MQRSGIRYTPAETPSNAAQMRVRLNVPDAFESAQFQV